MLYLDPENRLLLGRERAAELAADYQHAQRHDSRLSRFALRSPRLAGLPVSWRAVARRVSIGGMAAPCSRLVCSCRRSSAQDRPAPAPHRAR
jgi:hypothetical protein